MSSPAPDLSLQFTNVMVDADSGATSYGLGFQVFFVHTPDGVTYDLGRADAAYAAYKAFVADLTNPTPYLMKSVQVPLNDPSSTVVYGTIRVYGWDDVEAQLAAWGMLSAPTPA